MSRRSPGLRPRPAVPAARKALLLLVLPLVAALLSPPAATADDLGSARLLIAGTELAVSPESQTVPFNTPTIVDTDLTGYDPAQGVLPDDLRVLADFTGPEIGGILELETRPGEPFRIPRLSLKGEYLLDNIRLVQGDELLTYATPRSSVVLVTQVLVTRVTSRALTLDEIRSYGIVVDDDSFSAFNFTFGFAVDGEVYDYNLPVIYYADNSNPYAFLASGAPELGLGGSGFGTSSPRFRPPQMAPFTLELESSGAATTYRQTGGCQSAFGCQESAEVRLPGVILFPTDVSLLHQYFSVVLMAKNDAPEGDPLVIRDLTAKVTLPPGLRMAETEPPTPLGVPVPVRVPGPDGQVGTGDDLTFLVAQASGEAEVLVEGRKEGTHVVEFDLEGVLEGLPDGSLRRVTGKARGAVVVRDPSLGVTVSHPATVRADEEYDLRLTVSNTSNAPVNLVTLSLPASKLSGAQVVGASQATIPTLPPGESEVVEFRMRSLRTGKVVASSTRSPYFVDPTFELTVGVGENGIPLSPDAIVLPRSADALPAELVRQALGLTGLGYSLATAPAGLGSDLPRMDLNGVDGKVYHLGQAGRHVALGEDTFDAVATLAAEWTGVRDEDWEWDRLRRTTDRGGKLGDAVAAVLAAEAQATSPLSAFDRFAATTAFQGPLQAGLAVGAGARLEITSRTTGDRLTGGGLDPARRRELPFADLYDLAGAARMALLARPESGGHQARLTVEGGGSADLHLLVPGSGGGLRRVSWNAVAVGAAGLAVVDFTAGDDLLTLFVDGDGDGLVDQQLAGTATALAPRPFTAVAAVQKETEVTGHVVEVLFSADLDLASLLPLDPQRFQLPGNLSNGGLVPAEADLAAFGWTMAENKFAGLRNTRVVQVVFSNPVSPYVAHTLTVQDLASVTGATLASATLPVTTTVTDPGGIVEGTVVGPDGEPVPFARVEVYEADVRWIDGECIRHRTAAVQSDAAGTFRFDYVRNGTCSDVYLLRGTDPQTGHSGEARGRVRFPGQVHELDVVMLGRGTVRGRVTYDDGTVPAELDVIAHSPVFAMGVKARVFPDGSYQAEEVPVGTVSLAATDRQGSYVFQTIEIPTAGAVVDRDLVILRRSPEEATGDVRGTAYDADGVSPAYNAYLALYVDGELVGVERSGLDGSFDFGTVPAGQAEIEGFDGETGLAGAQVYFEVLADQVNEVDVLLRDERGAVEGHVWRQTAQGQVPVAGAVVWVSGTPFNTVTDDTGFYRLDGVFAGLRQVYAADLGNQEQTAEAVTVSDGLTTTRDLRFIEDFGEGGIVGEVLGFSGNPVPGALVHIAGGGSSWWHEVVTDTTGRFSIPDLKPGTYELHAVSGSGTNAVGGVGVAKIRFEGETPFVSIRFKKGTIRLRTVALDELGQKVGVTSLVTYRTTTVQEGLVGLAWTPTVVETDADGWLEIPDALAGRYSLAVSNAFHGDQTVSGELLLHGEVVEREIVFQRNGSISGVIYDVDGVTPVEGVVVHLGHPSFSGYDLVTDAAGRFTFDLVPPAGRIPIDVEVDQGALFRQARVWVGYSRYGLDMEVDVTLPVQGTVSGWVEEASGARVPGAVVTLTEHAYPRRRLVQTADGEGYYSFTNVFAGRVTVEAQAPSLGGLGGKTVAQVTTEAEEVWTLVALEGSGEIAGTVLSPVDALPVPSAQVTLYRWTGGVLDAVTADGEGTFRFRQLPIGLYRVWVFDPTTGRHGATDAVSVDADGQVVEITVDLEVRGEVVGHLVDPDSGANVPGATIELSTTSLIHFKTYSSADADGYYEFLGVPEGDFTLRTAEPQGRRRASAAGTISEEGERVTVDLFLEATGSVTGTVWNPPGAPAGPFDGVNTVVREGGRVVGSSLDNPFTIDGMIVGRKLSLEAYEVAGDHRAVASAVVGTQGEVVTVDLTMKPIGAVGVTVTDSFGAAVAGADLRLTSSGFYGRRNLYATTGADGRAQFADVGEGWLSAFVINPVNSLKGSASGQLTLDGEQVEIAVQLEDAATLRGRLLLADAVTPAEDALVTVSVSGRQYQLRADVSGDFELPSLPLGSFTLWGSEYFGAAASIERTGTLAANGEIVDLGTLVLDDEDPEVIAHTPPSGASDLPLTTAVTLHFNEPLDRGRFSSSWFKFRKLSGVGVSYTATWSDGDATVTLTPNGSLANFTAYEVVVDAAYDLAGRGLKERIKTVFSTVDQQPPGVVDVLPRDGQVQVPVDTNLRITFSEPVELASLSGTSLALVDTATGQQVTTTWQLAAEERLTIVTPQTLLLTDRTYQLTVQGVRDKSGNTMTVPVVTTFDTPDTIAPTIDAVTFPGGTSFTSGDDVPVSVTASDVSGVGRLTVRVVSEGWEFTTTSTPWQVSALAPVVASAGTVVTLDVEVADVYGNASTVQRTVDVSPLANATAPELSIACARDGDHVVPGFPVSLKLSGSDDQVVESYRLLVDGTEVEKVAPVNAPTIDHTFAWTPPSAPAGTPFAARVEVRDFAGNVGTMDLAFSVPTGLVLSAPQSVFAATAGSGGLTLAGGTYTVQEPLDLAFLTVLRGATLTGPATGPAVDLTVSGEMQVQCGASVELSGLGYAGGSLGHKDGYVPAGVTPSTQDAGGSHGGPGLAGNSGTAVVGEVYDSVYAPRLAGAGGSYDGYRGGAGGGALLIEADHLKLEGTIRAQGADASEGGAGAGGTVALDVATLSGSGTVTAYGGDSPSTSGPGGGGRVSVRADALDGFDPLTQISVQGGDRNVLSQGSYAAPGTTFVRTSGDTYGTLRLDNGIDTWDEHRLSEFVSLPTLGSGPVTSLQGAGTDAWVTADVALLSRWVGAWMTLLDAAGAEIGTYQVVDVDAQGAALLAGAATASGVVDYRGEYRFDRVEVGPGAGLAADDPVVTGEFVLAGGRGFTGDLRAGVVVVEAASTLEGSLAVQDLVVRDSATLSATGGRLDLQVAGTLTVEAGGRLGLTGGGYGSSKAPAGLTVSTGYGVGGSHGGRGEGSSGETFGSVYVPHMGGGGGAPGRYSGSPGGGVVTITAGELVLDGVVAAEGASWCGGGGGGGGAIDLRVDVLRGSGTVEAFGGHENTGNCIYESEGGGGGRVALRATTLVGFDPATQLRAWGGEVRGSGSFGGPGTVYYKLPEHTWGVLVVDNGELEDGTERTSDAVTALPELGVGTVSAFDAAGADAWLSGATGFRGRWLGTWVVLLDAAGGELGAFEVTELDAAGRLRLAGAGSVTGATDYRGEYRFDRVELRGGTSLDSPSRLIAAELTLEGGGALGGDVAVSTLTFASGLVVITDPLRPENLTVGSGATLVPEGTEPLVIDVPGVVTVEAGGVITVSGRGYPATTAPDGVSVSSGYGIGGSHGGRAEGTSGETYGSVYNPTQGGGGGSPARWSGSPGGGVLQLTAGELVLDGELHAKGGSWCGGGGGGGGTILLDVGTLRGSGLARADGGDRNKGNCIYDSEGGGGGRLALTATTLVGFDPQVQFWAWGGENRGPTAFGGPGTVFYRLPEHTWGVLVIDNGTQADGTQRTSDAVTDLPSIGRGVVGTVTTQGSDAWIEPQDPAVQLGVGVVGTWVRIAGVDYPVIDQTSDRRQVLLQGAAGAVAVGEDYFGVYKFDEVHVRGTQQVEFGDALDAPVIDVDPGASLTALDVVPPVVTVTAPAPGAVYTAGDSVAVSADVVDTSTLVQVVFTMGSQSVVATAAPWEASLLAPSMEVEGDVEIRVEATDAEGNVGVGTVSVRVQPLPLGDPPVVAFTCPSPGAMLAPATGLDVSVTASHDDGIEKVDFLVGDDPTVLATDAQEPYEHHFTAPADALDGEVLTFRARARSFGGTVAEATFDATVLAGNVVLGDTTLDSADLSLDGTSVIVAAGTLTVDGAHSFQDLVVLDGAAVSHAAITAGGQQGLDLAVTGDVYVACNGKVDVTGRGWPAALGRDPAGGEGVLSSEDFSTDLSAWQVVDDTTYQGPSNWHIYSGFLRMTRNVHDPNGGQVGTHIYRTDASTLDDFRLAFRLNSGDDDGIGTVFRYQDADNYYRFIMYKAASYRRLEKRVNGVFVTLVEDGLAYAKNRWYEMEVVADGPRIDVWMDGVRILSAEDDTFIAGTYGFAAVGNVGTHVDDVRVVTLGGAAPGEGGSHAGRGAGFSGYGRVVGSPYDPTDPGAGGGSRFGAAGGGVVRIAAGGEVVIDGAVSAAGEVDGGLAPLGAGGSVRLDGAAIRGAGTIDASGGGDGTARAAGGGGRVALYAATVDAGLLSRTLAAGGEASTAALTGGAGTVFAQRDAQPLGELILDNAGRATDAWTELLSVPAGTVDVVGVDTLNDATASFPHSLVGTEVALNGDTSTLWPVLGHADGGDTLTLDVASAPLSAVLGDGYELLYRFDAVTVRGGAQGVSQAAVTSTVPPNVDAGSTWSPAYVPSLAFAAPVDGESTTSGTQVTFTAVVDDVLGVEEVTLWFDGIPYLDDSTPFEWILTAPLVSTATPYPVSLVATDLVGNELQAAITLNVLPNGDSTPPQVTLGALPAEGDVVLPDISLGLPFTVSDAEKLHAWRVKVNGAVVEEGLGVDATQLSGSVSWSPPAGDPLGSVYAVVVEAEDYGGNLATEQRTVRTPAGPTLIGDQAVDGSYAGQHLTFGAGTFTVTAPLEVASLTLLDGAVVKTPAGSVLRVETAGEVRVQVGGKIDVSSLGYSGGTSSSPEGGAPAGIATPLDDGGGSHGGVTQPWHGSAGEVYDSVYRPHLAGGGGSLDNDGSGDGLSGGGVLEIVAGSVVLEGEVLAHGVNSNDSGRAGSAGGTVRIHAGSLSGAGSVHANGGYMRYCSTSRAVGAGGGGRIALLVDQFTGFDPAVQTRAWGGAQVNCGWSSIRYAAPGTVYVRTAASTYGDLYLDNSGSSSDPLRTPALPTELPSLGADAVTAVEVSGSDLWVAGPAPFKARWLGAWMTLLDATGGELGTFEVADLDGGGRALLSGAGTVSSAMSYRGEYRFDSVVVDDTAGLEVTDPLVASSFRAVDASSLSGPIQVPLMEIEAGSAPTKLASDLRPVDLTIRSGAEVQPLAGGTLRIDIPGTLTIETGAVVSATGSGYPGGVGAAAPGGAPTGIEPSYLDSGGSHGGAGYWWANPDSSGEVFDSVYLPSLRGGGGSNRRSGEAGGAGGGVVDLTAAEVVLDGSVVANGVMVTSWGSGESGGAGGTVLVRAGTLRGSGSIKANGGAYRWYMDSGGPGGGGRVALHVTNLDGFDPETKAWALPGVWYDYSYKPRHHAAAGTVYVRTTTSTYGDLRVDSGPQSTSVVLGPQPTALPVLGTGPVTATEISASDLWVTAPEAFQARWLGAWMVLLDVGGSELGTFEVVELDAAGRARLAAAGPVIGAVSFRGEYRFDDVVVKNSAGLIVSDPLVAANLLTPDASHLEGPIEVPLLDLSTSTWDTVWGPELQPTDAIVRSGVTIRPPSTGAIRIDIPGTLIVESGASLDANRGGFAGGTVASPDGQAPVGVSGSTSDAGGSHGGAGMPRIAGGVAGELYDSVYFPDMGGGGGALDDDGSGDGGRGGGVVKISAGDLVLDGNVWAYGVDENDTGVAAAAGGSVRIEAATLTGSGKIYAHGGYNRQCSSSRSSGAGGGGRIALQVGQITGFDLLGQTYVLGGALYDCSWNHGGFAGVGTLYVETASSTYGDLYLDSGLRNGAPRTPVPNTVLPPVGTGTVGTAEVDGDDPADLWIEPQDAAQTFALGVTGAWVRVNGADYRILDQSADRRRVLLGGAAGLVSTGETFAGVYKFDSVTVKRGAVLEFLDIAEPGTTDVDADSQLITP